MEESLCHLEILISDGYLSRVSASCEIGSQPVFLKLVFTLWFVDPQRIRLNVRPLQTLQFQCA